MSTADEVSPVGLWRDDQLLVVSRRDHKFPRRCIKSDSSADVSWHTISSDPGSAVVSGFAITMGMLSSPRGLYESARALSAMQDRQVSLAVPLSAQWYSRWRRTSRIGWTLILGGILCFIATTIGYVLSMAAGVSETVANLILIPFAIAIPAAIVGLIYLTASHKPIFSLQKVTPDYIWIRGASPHLLAELPLWQKKD